MTKLLIDENVNQRAIKIVPFVQKGFDVLLPEEGSYKGESDRWIEKKAETEGRVIVTCDKDFSPTSINRVPNGVLWFRPSRLSAEKFEASIQKFCIFLQKTYPSKPYEFSGKIFEIHDHDVTVWSALGSESHNFA